LTEDDNLVEAELVKIVIRDTSEQQYIFLKERHGERVFPIVIGYFEASAIDRHVRDVGTPRPMTHDLMGSLIEALGARIVRVVVNRLHENTFYARLHLDQGGAALELDCRPSDAIALAVQTSSPIYVAEEVIEAVTGM
jgi:bifunctional DNase/RNase